MVSEERKQKKKQKRQQQRREAALALEAELSKPEVQKEIEEEERRLQEQIEAERAESARLKVLWEEREAQAQKEWLERSEREAAEREREEAEAKERRRLAEEESARIAELLEKRGVRDTDTEGMVLVTAQERAALDPRSSRDFGTERDQIFCSFYLKTGSCLYGSACSRTHPFPEKSVTLLIKNMYTGLGMSQVLAEDLDDCLDYDEREALQHFDAFFWDVHEEFAQYGPLCQFKVCQNQASHLKGNVYVQYRDVFSAIEAFNAMNGRYYAGKQMVCEFSPVTRWKNAICGQLDARRSCPRGPACNFLHPYPNPRNMYREADLGIAPGRNARRGCHDRDQEYDRRSPRDGSHARRSMSRASSRYNEHDHDHDHADRGGSRAREDRDRRFDRNNYDRDRNDHRRHSGWSDDDDDGDDRDHHHSRSRSRSHNHRKRCVDDSGVTSEPSPSQSASSHRRHRHRSREDDTSPSRSRSESRHRHHRHHRHSHRSGKRLKHGNSSPEDANGDSRGGCPGETNASVDFVVEEESDSDCVGEASLAPNSCGSQDRDAMDNKEIANLDETADPDS